jgi:hypothetical protein
MGLPLPYAGAGFSFPPEAETLPDGSIGYRFTPSFEKSLEATDPVDLEAATIAVEQTGGPVLLLAGADDGLWPSCTLAQISLDRLVAHAHDSRHADELVCFPDAGHFAATVPGWPTTNSYTSSFGSWVTVMGGTPEGTAKSQRASRDAVRAFLAAALQR